MKPRSYRQRPTYALQMALKKKADQYVARDGQPPSVDQARLDGQAQDLNSDDRAMLKWCLKRLKDINASEGEAYQCLEFIEAILNSIYDLTPKVEERPQDQDYRLHPNEDPELHAWMMGKAVRVFR